MGARITVILCLLCAGCASGSDTGVAGGGTVVKVQDAGVASETPEAPKECITHADCGEGYCVFTGKSAKGSCSPCPACKSGERCNQGTKKCEAYIACTDPFLCPVGKRCADGVCETGCSTLQTDGAFEGCCLKEMPAKAEADARQADATTAADVADAANGEDASDTEIVEPTRSPAICGESHFTCIEGGGCVELANCEKDTDCPEDYACEEGQCTMRISVPAAPSSVAEAEDATADTADTADTGEKPECVSPWDCGHPKHWQCENGKCVPK